MQKTGIEYLSHVWNPIATRCTKASPGCDNCWHLKMAKRHAANPMIRKEVREARGGGKPWLNEKELAAPLTLRKPARIGVMFMGDLFHESVPDEWIAEVFGVMAVAGAMAPGESSLDGAFFMGSVKRSGGPHTFQVLTKRPGRMKTLLTSVAFRRKIARAAYNRAMDRRDAGYLHDCISDKDNPRAPCRAGRMWPLSNVHIGVTAENQEQADKRIPILLETPAAVRFVSVEPMLGAIALPGIGFPQSLRFRCGPRLDWVICGAETGPGKRPMDLDWARHLRGQCAAAGVPFFFKKDSRGGTTLDGKTHNEYPVKI